MSLSDCPVCWESNCSCSTQDLERYQERISSLKPRQTLISRLAQKPNNSEKLIASCFDIKKAESTGLGIKIL